MYQQSAEAQSSGGSAGRWQALVGIGGVLFGLVNFYEPVKDIYIRYADPDAYKDVVSVQYADMQKTLWQRNGPCVGAMEMRQVPLGEDVALRAGACPSGDILVQMYPKDRPAISHWMSLSQIGADQASASGLFPAAMAAELAPDALRSLAGSTAKPAQMTISTVCQAWENQQRQARLIRVTNENGQCFKEITNVYSGKIEYREKVACNATCKPDKPAQ
jgi:hypothetical protein